MKDNATQATAPYTGAEYLDSLQDGRAIYVHGERVKDVTKHPAFRNSARMVARWYDRLNDNKDTLGRPTDTGSGGWTHPFFKGTKSAEDLIAGRDAIVETQRVANGWMGRAPDYKAAFLGTLGGQQRLLRRICGKRQNLVRPHARAAGLLEPCDCEPAD